MKALTDQEIVAKDMEALYLGNLRTVEFDLSLVTKGKFGSNIQWATKDDRYITTEGKVSRPFYGKGDRTIQLTATFTHGAYSAKKTYDAKVLEEENNIVVVAIFPVKLTKKTGVAFYLPQAVSIKTEKGEILSHSVTWDNGNQLTFDTAGQYNAAGHIKDTDYTFTADIQIVDGLQEKVSRPKKAMPLPLQTVRLTGKSMMKVAQDRRLAFLLTVDDDQMLYNFRQAAGLDTLGAPEMIGWDSPDSLLKGHTTGHYLSALALAYGATSNEKILEKLHYMISELAKVQAAFEQNPAFHDGFLSAYSEEQFDLLEKYTPYPQIWAPYYTLHKIFAGLLDSYTIAHISQALVIADKLGDWTYARLTRLPFEQLKKMWGMYIAGEFGGMNESLATLYTLTHKPEHLAAARLFDNDRLFYPMEQGVDALGALHANQHIPQVVGAMEIYEASQIDSYYRIADFFWHSVTAHHIYSIGGTGDTEMFQQPDRIGTKISENTAETCASYNMLKLTEKMYQYAPTADKMDYYERTMLNHILASTDHEEKGASTYFMPTLPGGQKGYDDENSCCHGTGLENHFKYGEAIFWQGTDCVYVNLFTAARVKSAENQLDLALMYDDVHPEVLEIAVNELTQPLAVRKPYWATGDDVIEINGEQVKATARDGYYVLDVVAGDHVKIVFSIGYRLEATQDDPGKVSLAYGPYILVAVNDVTDYLVLDDVKGLVKDEDSLIFTRNNQTYVPLAKVNHEHYHVYMEKE